MVQGFPLNRSYTKAEADAKFGSVSGYQVATGTVNGINAIFTFLVAPKAISVDQGRIMQKVSSDGTVNWTGTTTITLTVAPVFDIFAIT